MHEWLHPQWRVLLYDVFTQFVDQCLDKQGDFVEKYHIFSNLIRTSFCRFLKRKKLVRGSNPHLSFNRPLPTRQTDSVMSDDGESDE